MNPCSIQSAEATHPTLHKNTLSIIAFSVTDYLTDLIQFLPGEQINLLLNYQWETNKMEVIIQQVFKPKLRGLKTPE